MECQYCTAKIKPATRHRNFFSTCTACTTAICDTQYPFAVQREDLEKHYRSELNRIGEEQEAAVQNTIKRLREGDTDG